ncbi:MAG: F0F1 ATP synthase subunit B [Chloroflexi bacterium]|nr:F0F1 ATP synthase subunit B [Chloroflexota bacterium]
MGALGINVSGLVTQIVSFVILFSLLWVLLYKPVVNMLDTRSQRIKESLEASLRAQQEAASSAEEVEKQLDTARIEGQQLIAQAREVADRFREDELAKVREDLTAERERAQANIQRERDAAIEDLRREFAGLAIVAAERVVERSLDGSAHHELIARVLEEGTDIGSRN